MVRVAFVLLLCLLSSSPALAEKRVALVIGNSAYQHTPRLANPKNDATDIAAALKTLGFQVLDGFDLDKPSFERKVRDFAAALQGAQVGVFFFAGHGLQVAGHNYLVPIDAQLSTVSALDFEMVRLDLVHRTMEREAQTNILFLDACRDNPLARNLARAMGTRSSEIGRGLAAVESGVGTLISFSTQPGNVALDGTGGRNSPFAGALVKHVVGSKDELSAILIDVRNDVRKETQNKQVPWEHSALTGRFYFNAAPQTALSPPAAPSLQPSEAERNWSVVKDATDIRDLEAYRRQYGGANPFFDRQAEKRIEELKNAEAAKKMADEDARAKVEAERQRLALLQQEAAQKRTEAAKAKKPGQVFRDCPDCPEMVVVPAGSFTMGSPTNERGRFDNEGPPRKVTIAKPFAVGKYEVTFVEWDACVADGGCKYTPGDEGWGRGKRPVINVGWWYINNEYLPWLSHKTSKRYRLLTEAEWEYATRAGTRTRFHFGDDERDLCTYANIADLTAQEKHKDWTIAICRDHHINTATVGSFRPNAFGLYDVHGNVWEWVQDCYEDSYARGPSDGSAVPDRVGCSRVLRGGSWSVNPRNLRAAVRIRLAPFNRDSSSGFRVARTLWSRLGIPEGSG